ncbi:sialic acid-binding Ig-like lectin 10 isoform X1 [Epinephelus lanceolatus]
MTLIYSVILCLFFKARICQLQCVKATLNDTEFSINVTTHIEVEAADCIRIPYEFTFPTSKVTAPYRKIWFKGDPQNTVTVVMKTKFQMKDTLIIDGLPRGEYEYGFKLEWGCNQTYIFPKRVRISVSALTRRPTVQTSPMKEGQYTTVGCRADNCNKRPKFHWEWTKAHGQSMVFYGGPSPIRDFSKKSFLDMLRLIPTADHHNTNITCVADYGHSVVKTTVTLTVKFPPRILHSSHCVVEGKLLVCVCVSRGNPLAPITWPSLTNFSVTGSSSIQTVNSTITMSAANYNNTSVKCISSNELGQAVIEIPLQNFTENLRLKYEMQKFDAALPWRITAGVSFSLNLVLLTCLIICTYKRGKRTRKKVCEEMNTYASLSKADVEQEYSVISPHPR